MEQKRFAQKFLNYFREAKKTPLLLHCSKKGSTQKKLLRYESRRSHRSNFLNYCSIVAIFFKRSDFAGDLAGDVAEKKLY
jgi:hypothetical protein